MSGNVYLTWPYSELRWFIMSWKTKLRSRRLWRNAYCRDSVGQKHAKFWASGGLSSALALTLSNIIILFLLFLICEPQQLKLMLSHCIIRVFNVIDFENSWGLKKCYIVFLYLATSISHLYSSTCFLLKKCIAPLNSTATDFLFYLSSEIHALFLFSLWHN